MDDGAGAIHLTLRVKMMMNVMNWTGLWKGHLSENVMNCGGNWKDQQPGENLVLDHIILDLTGDSVPLDRIADANVQKEYRRKKRLLRQSNTVLISRLGIMALVAVMLVATTILTWYFTSTYAARSVRSLADVLRDQLLRTSTQAMISCLGEVYNTTLVLSSIQQQVYFANTNKSWEAVEPSLRRVDRGVFDAQPQYSSVAFVASDGRLTDFTRYDNSDYMFFVNESSTSNSAVWYVQNVTGFYNESLAPPPTRRSAPYPISAGKVLTLQPLEEVYWTIAPNTLGEVVVSPAMPVRNMNSTGEVLGVATITTTFEYLNNYLGTLDLLDGYLYFEWHNGTGGSSIVAFSYNDSSDILASPEHSSNPVVRSAAYYLTSRYGYGMTVGETHNDDVTLLGQEYYIDTTRLTQEPYDTLNLTAVMILPRSSIMGRIDKRNQMVIHVIIGTAFGVLLLGCCFVCFLTSRMSTEMQLRQELIRLLVGKHRAEQSSNYKSQFLANMSHELRTPIAGIIGLLDLLSCDSMTSEQEFSVSQIRRCASGLLALVDNVLDISKAEAGKMELEIAPFSVADELESLVDMFAAQSVGSNIDVVLDLSDDIPPIVKGDSVRIRQIFSNLLSNSLKFTTQGHVVVRGWVDQSLGLSLLEPKDKQQEFSMNLLSGRERVSGPLFMSVENQLPLVFEVADSGSGIAPELYETVFDSFVQADSSTTRTHGGSGLGLYMVRSLVELMGGEVAVVPTDNRGTVMRFHIIVERASDPMPMMHRASAEGPRAFGSPSEREGEDSLLGSPFNAYEAFSRSIPEGLEKTQVLVAMEEGVARNVAVCWLERSGLKVTCVENWKEVVPTLEKMSTADLKPVRNDDSGGGGVGSLNFPSGVRSPGSMSQSSENMLEFSANFSSVLALVDVTLFPDMKVDIDRKVIDPGVLVGGNNDSNLSRSEVEKLPYPVQEMLDCMLRIHFQRSIAVSWVVAPDCGAKWKQALQADGCFLVLNKPLHGSRLRRLLSFVARAGKIEQHNWELHSSLFGSPLSPKPGTTTIAAAKAKPLESPFVPFAVPKAVENMPSPNLRNPSDQNSQPPSRRTSNARRSVDGELQLYHFPEILVKGPVLEASSVNDAKRIVPTVLHSGEQSSVISGNNSNNNTGMLPNSTSGPLSDSPESRRVRRDEKNGLYLQPKTSFDRTHSQNHIPNPPSNGLQRYQKVLPVDLLDRTEESRRLLSISTPESPLSGRSTPEISGQSTPELPMSRSISRNQGETGAADAVQETGNNNGVQVRDLDGEWGGRGTDLRVSRKLQHQKQAKVFGGDNRGQTRHEKPAGRPERGSGASSPASAFIHNALAGMHILLVEDTAVLQRLVSMTLEKMGAHVTVVGDGLQAVTAVAETVEATQTVEATRVAAAAASKFDLILMDCAMPVMDGYNATKAIREAEESTNRHIPIVALTAHALASDEERCLSVGMDAYLTKPINCKLMVTTIRGLLSKDKA